MLDKLKTIYIPIQEVSSLFNFSVDVDFCICEKRVEEKTYEQPINN